MGSTMHVSGETADGRHFQAKLGCVLSWHRKGSSNFRAMGSCFVTRGEFPYRWALLSAASTNEVAMWGGGTGAFGFAKDGSWQEKDDKNIRDK
ncbi:hypothetical protein E4U17_002251 [Claviceps sp. LM77 group G4]|nr:hypothetical protein E4U17_002251 [Claviceps sp. LM77 group G4]